VSFLDIVRRARDHLQENGRISLRALRREFGLDDEELEELVEELVDIQRVATREERALAWTGAAPSDGSPAEVPEAIARDPRAYTPKHLADKILQSKSALEGERKQVTVLFADVKGSMDLAAQVDPEEWHRILERFFEILGEGVHRFEGTVNQYTGDGIMALFGAPIAHEDHAQRACYASLHLLEELREYAREVKRAHGLDFAVRIGLNSGDVVVGRIGDDLRMDYTAQGHTVGLAQRMESLAEPNTCALSESTRALVSGYFDLEDLGEFAVKGLAEPISVHALRGVGSARTRLDLSRARGFTKFVGRGREMQSLESALEEALAGNGQAVGVVAQAGTGKSRLCLEFIEQCRARGLRVNEAHCPAHGKTVAYLPLLEMLRSIFEISDRDGDHEARRKIAGELLLLDASFQELLPLVFDFLGVPDPDRPAPELTPEQRQRQMMAFVRHLTEARSRQEPSVLLLDDLHWIDPGSDAFLAQAIEAVNETRTLFVVNFRPEYSADWMAKSYYRQLPLAPLGREAIEELLLDLLGADPSLSGLPGRIHDRTGGNPFFIEEVVQTLIESGALEGSKGAYRLVAPADAIEIPATVQSVLAARIDRLAEREKRVLQTASVVGKEIPEPILARVSELAPEDLTAALSVLVQSEFMFEKALYPDVEFAFKHPLTHEVAYLSQLADRRTRTHAEEPRAAANWHGRAARWCERDNPGDAVRHWRRVHSLLRADAEGGEFAELRLEAVIHLLNLGWRQGMERAETDLLFEEGRSLAKRLGRLDDEVLILVNRCSNFFLSGEPAEAGPLMEEAERLAAGNALLECLICDSISNAGFWLGDLQRASDAGRRRFALALEAGIVFDPLDVPVAWYPAWRGYHEIQTGRLDDSLAAILSAEKPLRELGFTQSISWWNSAMAEHRASCGLGREAMQYGQRAVDLAEEAASSTALVFALAGYAKGSLEAGELEAAESLFVRALEAARETRSFLSLEALMLAGLARTRLQRGAAREALETAEEGVRVGVQRCTPVLEGHAQLAMAAATLALSGPSGRAPIEAALSRCRAIVEQTGARLLVPHACELRARLADATGDTPEAERELREAHRLFAEQGAEGHASRLSAELAG
jgi:class 3 adenylate cyclase